ncbi:poly-gamma-glutamate hydrolase family protein [Nocardia arizonensis]|uniref:poly-gamma-glutamate hydrolase family protein n=1 Tax=Nocardia arizonensis TaxID=1141647 RepID=UPI0006D19FBF|nr:poly-gamma-glutamate hydrolase family protein [Nocardia arizonensis]
MTDGAANPTVTVGLITDPSSPEGRHDALAHPLLIRRLDAEPGAQVRIATVRGAALYTLRASADTEASTYLALTPGGLRRLGHEAGTPVTLRIHCADSMSRRQARRHNGFIEECVERGDERFVLALAPHGGDIEKWTDLQAYRVAYRLGWERAAVWACLGWYRGGGAYRRWHIASTDLHHASFPKLRALSDRPYRRTVAFHGYRGNTVLIGGGCEEDLKWRVHSALRECLRAVRIPVRLVGPDEPYGARSHANIVNRFAVGGAGLQLEQPLAARSAYWRPIADAVADVLAHLPKASPVGDADPAARI